MQRTLFFSMLLSVTLMACAQPEPHIDFGKAECAYCRMNVVDRQFAAVLITDKGKQYAFDGVECMVPFVNEGLLSEKEVAGWYVCDHAHPARLIDATMAHYVHGEAYRSPMRGDMAAFADPTDRDSTMHVRGGEAMDWARAKALLSK